MEAEITPKGQTYRGIARAIKVVIFAVVVITLIVLARIVFVFFGQLKTLPGYQFVIDFSETLVEPFKSVGTVRTPYEGVFDIGATILLILLIFGEFVLSGIAGFFNRRARSEIVGETQMPSVQVVVSPTIGSTIGNKAPEDESALNVASSVTNLATGEETPAKEVEAENPGKQ